MDLTIATIRVRTCFTLLANYENVFLKIPAIKVKRRKNGQKEIIGFFRDSWIQEYWTRLARFK